MARTTLATCVCPCVCVCVCVMCRVVLCLVVMRRVVAKPDVTHANELRQQLPREGDGDGEEGGRGNEANGEMAKKSSGSKVLPSLSQSLSEAVNLCEEETREHTADSTPNSHRIHFKLLRICYKFNCKSKVRKLQSNVRRVAKVLKKAVQGISVHVQYNVSV